MLEESPNTIGSPAIVPIFISYSIVKLPNGSYLDHGNSISIL